MTELYIGLMSGTSADGIDAVLVNLNDTSFSLLASLYYPFSAEIQKKILCLSENAQDEIDRIDRLGELDILLGKAFAYATNQLLKDQSISKTSVKAIGCHGQTIRHHPRNQHPFTLQIGDPNTIAALTGITTVCDFRRKDIALGGVGAPLVPAFHYHFFSSETITRAIVNIGGIANITFLPKKNDDPIIGFDSGPGNVLMDAWIYKHQNKFKDDGGVWGASGTIIEELLVSFQNEPYFQLSPPKSTGREDFNLNWLNKHLLKLSKEVAPIDVQRTLVELTATSIINTIRHYMDEGEILICGGGAHNIFLMQRLSKLANPLQVKSTEFYGMHPDWVEASAFAWLAKQTMNGLPGNLPSVTGASKYAILGGVYFN